MDQPLPRVSVRWPVWAIAGLVAFGWVLVAAVHPNYPGRWLPQLGIMVILGTMFGHAALAATWCALGPLAFVSRLPLSALWMGVIAIAFGVNLTRDSGDDRLMTLAVFSAAVLLQWGVTQVPLWLIAGRLRLRLSAPGESLEGKHAADHQFGIRQLLILTTLVALVLGAGRLMLGGLQGNESSSGPNGVGAFMCLAVANALLSLPVLAAAFLDRARVVAAIAALIVVMVSTALEVPLMMWLFGQTISVEDCVIFLGINLVQSAWILIVLGLLRAGDVRLVRRAE